MCGVVGIVAWDGRSPAIPEVERMIDRVAHRGPDGRGHAVGESWVLGHARLAVIDLAGGSQPMKSPAGRTWISYNGEIYNYRELRAELRGLGHSFETDSDTEVILAAWREWGSSCVERFRGMFAFAIVDEDRGRTFLARDHLGIKPLCYFATAGEIIFASELQALATRPDRPSAVSLEALDLYFALSYIPAPLTIYEGVRKLPPAHTLTIDMRTGSTRGPERYWSPSFPESRDGTSEADRLEEIEAVLRSSVRAHLVSDVPVGAFLSGGVDSSLIVSLMSEEMGEPVPTFSIGFEEEEFNELPFAREVARIRATDHRERVVQPDALGILDELVRHHGEPFGDWSSIPTFYLSELAREGVAVVLSGDGGDEGFAGYSRYQRWIDDRGRLSRFVARIAGRGGGVSRPRDWEDLSMMVLRQSARRSLWREELADRIPADGGPLATLFRATEGAHPLDRARAADVSSYLPGAILTKVDVASMYHGLEVRTPLVDIRVIELAAALPPASLIGRRRDGTLESKRPLRRLLRRYFSDEFVDRPKRGFVPPVREWLSADGPARAEVERLLVGDEARTREFVRADAASRLLSDLRRGGPAEPVWLLLFLEAWLRREAGRPTGRLESRGAV